MASESSLDRVPVGRRATITHVDGGDAMTLRLLEMGLTPGTAVAVVKLAPLGDPMELEVRGYHVSLRRNEAARVRIEVVS